MLNKTRLRWTDLVRSLFYETLPFSCLAILWTIAWAGAVVTKANRNLEAVHDHAVAIHEVPDQPSQITFADDSN